jgi:hypothetical protein
MWSQLFPISSMLKDLLGKQSPCPGPSVPKADHPYSKGPFSRSVISVDAEHY